MSSWKKGGVGLLRIHVLVVHQPECIRVPVPVNNRSSMVQPMSFGWLLYWLSHTKFNSTGTCHTNETQMAQKRALICTNSYRKIFKVSICLLCFHLDAAQPALSSIRGISVAKSPNLAIIFSNCLICPTLPRTSTLACSVLRFSFAVQN